jgi:hypothetical protein
MIRSHRAARAFGGLGCLLLGLTAVGCDGSPSEPDNMVDGGSWYVTGYRWPHDGRPGRTRVRISLFTVTQPAIKLGRPSLRLAKSC